jgi:hypothetical protein
MVSDLHVGEAEVAHILPKKEWAVQDAYRTANASPAVFGLLRSCLVSLSHMGKERAVPTSEQLAQEWSEQVRAIRSRAYTLIDEVPVEEYIDERDALRAESLYLLHQVTSAGVTVAGGRGMLLDADAQRWAREAMFLLIQAQTSQVRKQLLTHFASA